MSATIYPFHKVLQIDQDTQNLLALKKAAEVTSAIARDHDRRIKTSHVGIRKLVYKESLDNMLNSVKSEDVAFAALRAKFLDAFINLDGINARLWNRLSKDQVEGVILHGLTHRGDDISITMQIDGLLYVLNLDDSDFSATIYFEHPLIEN